MDEKVKYDESGFMILTPEQRDELTGANIIGIFQKGYEICVEDLPTLSRKQCNLKSDAIRIKKEMKKQLNKCCVKIYKCELHESSGLSEYINTEVDE